MDFWLPLWSTPTEAINQNKWGSKHLILADFRPQYINCLWEFYLPHCAEHTVSCTPIASLLNSIWKYVLLVNYGLRGSLVLLVMICGISIYLCSCKETKGGVINYQLYQAFLYIFVIGEETLKQVRVSPPVNKSKNQRENITNLRISRSFMVKIGNLQWTTRKTKYLASGMQNKTYSNR